MHCNRNPWPRVDARPFQRFSSKRSPYGIRMAFRLSTVLVWHVRDAMVVLGKHFLVLALEILKRP